MMNTQQRPTALPDERVRELQRILQDREETIRLLNEALSQALDELNLADEPRAA
ncbi:MAG: hypothetical protein HYX50_05525 [Chloroflexi bacterium]|nr:hypothetical protein [Chloroflexota bacterium]